MSLAVNLQNLSNFLRVGPPPSAAPQSRAPIANRANLAEAQRQLYQLFQSLVKLDQAVNGSSSLRLEIPEARSQPGLALDLTSLAAQLASVEEVNATPTSFTPFGPEWDDGSTAQLSVNGIYDGTAGSGSLSFEVRRAGIRGLDQLRLRVRNPSNSVIGNITIQARDPLDRIYSLGNGLSFTLGAGSLINSDTTSIQLFAAIGSSVRPDQPFNGVNNGSANLQFGLPAVVDGAFQLNDETIPVSADDSLDSVLNRINQSVAGVTASFNSASERIEFVQNTAGAAPTIDLASDTSNFLQATKLNTAVVVPGKDPDNLRPLADVAQFAGAQSGTFSVNGQAIALDVQTDSLADVVARINASEAGATASFDEATGELTLRGSEGQSTLEIDSNGTGLFPALNLPDGTVAPDRTIDGLSQRRLRQVSKAVSDVARGLNNLFNESGLLNQRDSAVIALRGRLESAVSGLLGGSGRLDSGIGLRFNTGAARTAGDFVEVDQRKLARFLQRRGSDVRAFFNGGSKGAGFSKVVAGVVEQSVRSFATTLGPRGTRFDGLA